MKNYIAALVLVVVFASPVNADSIQDLLDQIVAIPGASPENEAWLETLFEHPDQGVRVSAKMRIAELYWKSGRSQQAEAMLDDISAKYDTYSPKYKVESLLTRAVFELRRNNFIEVEAYAKQAASVAEQADHSMLPNAHYYLGSAYINQGKLLAAKAMLARAATGYEQEGNVYGVSSSYNSLGLMYKNAGDLSNGIKYLLKAREAAETLGNINFKATVYYNLADLFLDSGEPERAKDYYQNALELDLQTGDLGNIAYDYTGLSSVMFELEQYNDALQTNQKAIKHLLEIDAPQELSRAYLQQAAIYTKLEDQAARLKSLLLAQDSAEAAKSPFQMMSVNSGLGQYHLAQEALNDAQVAFSKAWKVAEELSLDNKKFEISKWLATTYERLNNYEKAHYYSKTGLALQQQLNNEDQREKTERYKRDLNLLEEQLKVSQLEQTQVEQAQDLQEQKLVQQRLITFMVAIALIFIALLFVVMQRRKLAVLKAKLFEDALAQKQQLFADVSHELRTPLTALKLQIQALQYDLVSDVQSSYDKLAGKVTEINRLISDIYQLAQADTDSIELNAVEVELAPLFNQWREDWQGLVERSGFHWQCRLDLADGRKSLDQERIKQVIDNLLSNSTFYTDKPGTICLTAKFHDNKLNVTIEDTAPTVEEGKLKQIFERLYRIDSSRSRQTGGSGLGLAICKSLIKAHGGSIRALQSKLGGLKVEFRI